MQQTREYTTLLQQRGLHHWVINRKLSLFRFIVRSLLMIISLPLFLFGYINNLIPFAITKRFANKAKDPMLRSSFQYVSSTVATFPIYYLLLLGIVWIISKKFWIALVYVVLTFLTALFVHYYKIAIRKFYTVFHAMSLRHTADYQKLSSLQKLITGAMERIIF